MSKLLHTLEIDGDKFQIFGSLKVGDTIRGEDKNLLTVPDEKTLKALKEGNAPKKKGRPKKEESADNAD